MHRHVKRISTDQRGFPRSTAYGSNTCIDSGAVQANFLLSFSTEPPASIPAGGNFTAAILLSENGSPFRVSSIVIPLALSAGGAGLLNVETDDKLRRIGGFQQPPGRRARYRHTLATNLALTASGVSPALGLATTSTLFNVTPSNVQITIASAPAGLTVTVDGVSYSAPVTLTWAVGSQHTLAEPSPQNLAGAQYAFASWSDGGAASHTITASTDTPSYTATFTVTMYQLNISANPSSEGTIASASGNFYGQAR